MNTIRCEGALQVAEAATQWCEQWNQKGARSLFVPAGETPKPVYKLWEEKKPAFLNSFDLYQVDDVLTGEKRGIFKEFFETELPSFQPRMRYIDDGNGAADISMLGLGLNGHIAFHEPEIPSSLYSACVRLSAKTCQTLSLDANTWGITYGAQAFMATRAILFLVRGASKREILSRVLARDPKVPASLLLAHHDVTFIMDKEAMP